MMIQAITRIRRRVMRINGFLQRSCALFASLACPFPGCLRQGVSMPRKTAVEAGFPPSSTSSPLLRPRSTEASEDEAEEDKPCSICHSLDRRATATFGGGRLQFVAMEVSSDQKDGTAPAQIVGDIESSPTSFLGRFGCAFRHVKNQMTVRPELALEGTNPSRTATTSSH